METAPNLTELTVEDTAPFVRFCSNFPGDQRSLTFWDNRIRHWWLDNPAMPASWIRGAKLTDGDSIVGVSSGIPIRIYADKTEQVAVIRSTWRVLPAYRQHSIALTFFAESLYTGMVNLNSTSIPSMVPLLAFSGWKPVRSGITTTTILGDPLAFGCRLARRRLKSKPLPLVSSQPMHLNQEEILAAADATWQATRHQCTSGPVRDANYFRWFALDNPTMPFSWFAIPASNPLDSVFALATHFDDGALQVMDVWPPEAPAANLKALIQMIVSAAKRHRFHSISVPQLFDGLESTCRNWKLSKTLTNPNHFYSLAPKGQVPITGGIWPLSSGDVGI